MANVHRGQKHLFNVAVVLDLCNISTLASHYINWYITEVLCYILNVNPSHSFVQYRLNGLFIAGTHCVHHCWLSW